MLGIEPIGFSPPVLARNGDARRVNNVSLDITSPQPTRKPKTVAARLKGNRHTRDRVSILCSLVTPAV